MNPILRNWLILIVCLVITAGGLRSFWYYLLSPANSPDNEPKRFVIFRGENSSDIAKRLKAGHLIRSASAFTILVRRMNAADKIQPGNYKLFSGMSTPEIVSKLVQGPLDRWITLLEGWRVEEMAEKLNRELGISKNEFLEVAKEGYMFPDTYLFNPETKVSDIAQTMRDNFEKKYSFDLQAKITNLGITPEEGVILASIVEREARSDEARRMVASILLKRLNIGMGLNADATIQYALGYQKGEKSWWKRHLTKEDLKVDSLYNTYFHRGLPLTPISNPGLSSLKAVAGADSSTPYLYYYHDSQGRSHYAKTLEEHNQNIAEYP